MKTYSQAVNESQAVDGIKTELFDFLRKQGYTPRVENKTIIGNKDGFDVCFDVCVINEKIDERKFSASSREKLAKKGFALPDGSYPIETVTDLENAIQAYGRAKDKEAAKEHIKKRAKELNKENILPENW